MAAALLPAGQTAPCGRRPCVYNFFFFLPFLRVALYGAVYLYRF